MSGRGSPPGAQRRRAMVGAGAASGAVAAVTVVVLAVTGSGGPAHRRAGNPPAAPITASTTHVAASSRPSGPGEPTTPGRLVSIGASPTSAPGSLASVPAGYQFLGATTAGDITTYGSPQANHNTQDWAGKLVILTGQIPPLPDVPFTETIIGRPAAITWTPGDGWGWVVIIKYSPTIQINIQVPLSVPLTRAQVHPMADTLTVRDVSNPAQG